MSRILALCPVKVMRHQTGANLLNTIADRLRKRDLAAIVQINDLTKICSHLIGIHPTHMIKYIDAIKTAVMHHVKAITETVNTNIIDTQRQDRSP